MLAYMYVFYNEEQYRDIRASIQEEIEAILGVNDSFLMNVAINEAINNALRSNTLGQAISLMIKVTPSNRLIVRIKDSGQGFDTDEVMEKLSSSPCCLFEERLLDECGRGLSIMKCAADRMYYNRQGNELLLMKHINYLNHDCTNFRSVEVQG